LLILSGEIAPVTAEELSSDLQYPARVAGGGLARLESDLIFISSAELRPRFLARSQRHRAACGLMVETVDLPQPSHAPFC
jgi:hypothetical protein